MFGGRLDLARLRAWVVIGVTCAAVLSPLVPEWRGREGDSFPLSQYPMFAKERPAFEQPIYVIGRGPDGVRRKIDVSWWTSGGFNQGRNMLTATLNRGPNDARLFCAELAEKVARKQSKKWAKVEEVAVMRGRYDRGTFFGEGIRKPLFERTLLACPVKR